MQSMKLSWAHISTSCPNIQITQPLYFTNHQASTSKYSTQSGQLMIYQLILLNGLSLKHSKNTRKDSNSNLYSIFTLNPKNWRAAGLIVWFLCLCWLTKMHLKALWVAMSQLWRPISVSWQPTTTLKFQSSTKSTFYCQKTKQKNCLSIWNTTSKNSNLISTLITQSETQN